jgi:TonB family protein
VSESPVILPDEIRRAHANSTVGLLITVGADGTVKNAVVISELCPECDRAALEAVRGYRFQPAIDAEGKPIESRIAIALRI